MLQKNQRSPENKHHCNEVTCVSKSLFLTIAQFQQLFCSLNSLTYPNYPYIHNPIQCIYIYIFLSIPTIPTRTWSKAPTSPRSSRSPPPTSTASWSSHDSCGEALAISFVHDIDVHKKCSRIHVACFNCPRGRYIYIYGRYIYIWKVYIQCVYIYIYEFSMFPLKNQPNPLKPSPRGFNPHQDRNVSQRDWSHPWALREASKQWSITQVTWSHVEVKSSLTLLMVQKSGGHQLRER